MNSAENETITFQVVDKNDTDYLVISFPAIYGKADLEIDINDKATCQNSLRSLFAQLVEILIDNDVTVSFIKNDNYPRELIQSAIELYVEDLKNEICTIKQQISEELSDDK